MLLTALSVGIEYADSISCRKGLLYSYQEKKGVSCVR